MGEKVYIMQKKYKKMMKTIKNSGKLVEMVYIIQITTKMTCGYFENAGKLTTKWENPPPAMIFAFELTILSFSIKIEIV